MFLRIVGEYRSVYPDLNVFYPFPKQQILDFSELKDFAENNFNLDENGRMFSKRVENTVGKGEICSCFQKTCSADT